MLYVRKSIHLHISGTSINALEYNYLMADIKIKSNPTIVWQQPKRWITIQEAVRLYPFGRKWFERQIDMGDLPFQQEKPKAKIILDTRDIDRLFESRKTNKRNQRKKILDKI